MNSLLQQLYHIPAFSSGLLSISDNTYEATDHSNDKSVGQKDGSTVNAVKIETMTSENSHGISDVCGSTVQTVKTVKAGPSDDEKLLFQLQVMFGYLRLSEKRFYDTLSFCKVANKTRNISITTALTIIL